MIVRPRHSSTFPSLLAFAISSIIIITSKSSGCSASSIIIEPIPSFQPVRINCGSAEAFSDSDGNFWRSDELYLIGNGYEECPSDALAAHTDMPQLYCGNRWFDTATGTYEIPVNVPGTYQVTLHFAEIYFTDPGMRVFDVALEGNVVQSDLDIVAQGGGLSHQPIEFTYDVLVLDRVVTIDLIKKIENPNISGIQVRRLFEENGDFRPYVPGNLIVEQYGLLLSEGLSAKLIATADQSVRLANGAAYSEELMHIQPDGAACFPDTNPFNPGGWIYVSNSEAKPDYKYSEEKPGGVGAFTFDAQGVPISYRMILNNTRANCGGGTTPWGAWISGEEYHDGQVWQVDPTGVRPAQRITLGMGSPGMFESFAHDLRDQSLPRFFMSKDDAYGELTRLYVLFACLLLFVCCCLFVVVVVVVWIE